MIEQEKVIKGLQGVFRCVSPVNHTCGDCPYQDNHVGCIRRVLNDAITLLKAQAPRVMTLEDLQKIASIRDGAVWLEAGAGLMPAFMEFATKDITFFVAVPLTGYRQFFENDWYGKSWRCWDKMPTDEQRKAVAWND